MREAFDSAAYYHVYNRGVDKRPIFLDSGDFQRFYESMYLFNDANFVHPGGRGIDRDTLLASYEMSSAFRSPHVSIVAFCLMRNHFHLLLRQHEPEGISKFLHRLGMGYANYFNLKYERTGSLCEGPFKAKAIDTDEHLQLLPRYIHLNALDDTGHGWRASSDIDWVSVMSELRAYPWSSHHVYLEEGQLLPVVDETIVRGWFPMKVEYIQYLRASRIYGDEELTFSRLLEPGV